MKRLSKLLALTLAVVMVLAMATTAFAASDGSVTINNATVGETYKIYKVFDLTYSGSGETSTGTEGGDPLYNGVAYTYTKATDPDDLYTALIAAESPFTLTATTTPNVYNVTLKSGKTASDVSTFLKNNEGKLTAAAAAVTATTTEVKWEGLGYGYYYITSSVGSTVTIDSTLKNVVVKDKNTLPSLTKTVSDEATGTYGNTATIKIGDTAYFKIEVTDGKGTDKELVVHDTMATGLTLDVSSFKVQVGGVDVDTAKYSITYSSTALTKGTAGTGVTAGTLGDGDTFEVTFNAGYMATLDESKTIVITYSAELNKNAVIAGAGNTNTAKYTYSAQTSTPVTVAVKTYEQDVVKTDASNKLLDGASFKLYNASTAGTAYNLVLVEAGVYRIAESTDASSADKLIPKDGKLTIRGLENGTYYLEEVEAPSGYKMLTAREAFTIDNANNNATITGDTYTSGGIQIINQTGVELPSTGGIGTTIFYVVGAVLVLGAGVLLITKKRMSDAR